MSETIGNSRLIEDKEIALEVAEVGNEFRSIAAAKRIIDPIAIEAKGLDKTDFAASSDVSQRIMGAYAIYPEVFTKLFRQSADVKQLSPSDVARAISEIISRGELPTYKLVNSEEKYDAESFDQRADIVEEIAEALAVNSPSQDFLKDFELGREIYTGTPRKRYEMAVTVRDIKELLGLVTYHSEKVRTLEGEIRWNEKSRAEVESNSTATKIQRVLYSLELVDHHMPTEAKEQREAFKARVESASNQESTSIADLMALYSKGLRTALELHAKIRDEKRAIYDAIISGEALKYSSIESKPESLLERIYRLRKMTAETILQILGDAEAPVEAKYLFSEIRRVEPQLSNVPDSTFDSVFFHDLLPNHKVDISGGYVSLV